jgi:hypothetical protein
MMLCKVEGAIIATVIPSTGACNMLGMGSTNIPALPPVTIYTLPERSPRESGFGVISTKVDSTEMTRK